MVDRPLHGVNLTGWLTLESWVTPELFCGAGALDESALVSALGAKRYGEVVRQHRESFVTRDDFVRIASRGFNAVRLPVPWYVYGDDGPDHGSFIGCIDLVDKALEWAEEIGLKVIFVLAIALGGAQAEGELFADDPDFPIPREQALDVLFALSKRYASRMGFFGIEIADEVTPQVRHGLMLSDGIAGHRLRNYYRDAYELVRAAAGEEPFVIMPDAGIPNRWARFMAQRHYVNVWLDSHLDRVGANFDVAGPSGIQRLVASHSKHIRDAKRSGMPVMVGTWSSSLPLSDSVLTPEGRLALERVYTSEQIGAYDRAAAWFFNTWKTSGLLASWDARVAMATLERGMIV